VCGRPIVQSRIEVSGRAAGLEGEEANPLVDEDDIDAEASGFNGGRCAGHSGPDDKQASPGPDQPFRDCSIRKQLAANGLVPGADSGQPAGEAINQIRLLMRLEKRIRHLALG
jgi:hypothetical protein